MSEHRDTIKKIHNNSAGFYNKTQKKDELFYFKSEKVFVAKIRGVYYVPVTKRVANSNNPTQG